MAPMSKLHFFYLVIFTLLEKIIVVTQLYTLWFGSTTKIIYVFPAAQLLIKSVKSLSHSKH